VLASIGSMPEDEAWIYFALNLAKGYVGLACGELLSGCKIQIQWHDHELGSHPFLCLSTKAYIQEKYITAAEYALRVFDGAVCWSLLREHFEQQIKPEDTYAKSAKCAKCVL